jgi:hypothetical protein
VVAYQNQAATYQVVDGLIDMWPLVRSEKWGYDEAELADFFAGFLQSDVNPAFGNALLGFPPNRSMEVMYYNEAWLAELGADGPPTDAGRVRRARLRGDREPVLRRDRRRPQPRLRDHASTPAASPAGPSRSAATCSTTRTTATRSTPRPRWRR